jgi:hypothetical protein
MPRRESGWLVHGETGKAAEKLVSEAATTPVRRHAIHINTCANIKSSHLRDGRGEWAVALKGVEEGEGRV